MRLILIRLKLSVFFCMQYVHRLLCCVFLFSIQKMCYRVVLYFECHLGPSISISYYPLGISCSSIGISLQHCLYFVAIDIKLLDLFEIFHRCIFSCVAFCCLPLLSTWDVLFVRLPPGVVHVGHTLSYFSDIDHLGLSCL